MRVPRIYCSRALADLFEAGQQLELDAFASNHLCKVLRMTQGRPLVLFDGLGGEYVAEILQPDARRTVVKLLEYREGIGDSPLDVCLALALSRADRFDWALQKVTELGVSSVQPLITQRSEKWSTSRAEKKAGHWQRLMISAAEQCGRCSVPELREPCKLDAWQAPAADRHLILQPGGRNLNQLASEKPPSKVILVVGPEGGFDDAEVDQLVKAGFISTGLGRRILRTETAPVATLALLQFLWGDLG